MIIGGYFGEGKSKIGLVQDEVFSTGNFLNANFGRHHNPRTEDKKTWMNNITHFLLGLIVPDDQGKLSPLDGPRSAHTQNHKIFRI